MRLVAFVPDSAGREPAVAVLQSASFDRYLCPCEAVVVRTIAAVTDVAALDPEVLSPSALPASSWVGQLL